MFQDMRGSLIGDGDRRKRAIGLVEEIMQNPSALKTIGGMAGGMENGAGGAEVLPNPTAAAPRIGPAMSSGNPAAEIPMPERMGPPPMRREDVAVPQLPGRVGEPRPYDRVTAGGYDYVMGRPNSYDADPDTEGRQKMGIGGRLKSGLKPALIGLLQGMGRADTARGESALARGLGGAAGGFGVGIGDPTSAREWEFQTLHQPGIESQMKREQDEAERVRQRRIGDIEITGKEAEVKGINARTAATIAGTKDAELFRRQQEANIAKTEAQTEAQLRGKDVVKMIPNPQTGELEEIRFFADGTSQVLGKSGQAVLKREGVEAQNQRTDKQIKSREGITDKQIGARKVITGMQQGGANYRAGLSQSGQNQRQKERLGAQYGDEAAIPYGPPTGAKEKAPAVGSVPVKRATTGDVNEYAKQRGISPAEARRRFEAKGYRVE